MGHHGLGKIRLQTQKDMTAISMFQLDTVGLALITEQLHHLALFILGLIFFYALQRRELRRFFEQQETLEQERKAQRKQEQMT